MKYDKPRTRIEIAELLKQFRNSKGMRQWEVANKLRKHAETFFKGDDEHYARTISKVENGKQTTLPIIQAYSMAFDLDMNFLTFADAEPQPRNRQIKIDTGLNNEAISILVERDKVITACLNTLIKGDCDVLRAMFDYLFSLENCHAETTIYQTSKPMDELPIGQPIKLTEIATINQDSADIELHKLAKIQKFLIELKADLKNKNKRR